MRGVETALPRDQLARLKSKSQCARISTEAWAAANLYCPNCDSIKLDATRPNNPAIDYICGTCDGPFQLKAQSRPLSGRIADAAYSTMVRAIRENRTPNLFLLHYEPISWHVVDLILIPRFGFPLSAIEKRAPLGPAARRAGWVGCNILLNAIPADARIDIIVRGRAVPRELVRQRYARARPFAQLQPRQRGWMLDVLNVIRSLNRNRFSLRDAYGFEEHLSRLHPANRHVRDKIRQQLQLLRDMGFIDFVGSGNYSLRRAVT